MSSSSSPVNPPALPLDQAPLPSDAPLPAPLPSDAPLPSESEFGAAVPEPDLFPADAANITDDSVHLFDSYDLLLNFVKQYAATSGFEVRPKVSGGVGSASHSGTLRCWCYPTQPSQPSEPSVPSVPNRRAVLGGKLTVRVKCGCCWRVSFYRREGGEYVITPRKRTLVHSGHEVADPFRLATTIASLRHVQPRLCEAVKAMVKSGIAVSEAERRFLMDTQKVSIDKDVFRNLVHRVKADLGMYDSASDFARLLQWLQEEMRNSAAVARYHVELGHVLDGVFYMSADMVYNFGRNSVAVVMDTTFKTNRFGWPLLIVCGVNEHGQTVVFAVAVLHHQTTEAFTWVLESMREAVAADDWAAINTVLTDGDQAMSAAISSVWPHVHHVRCIYHLEMNLRDKFRDLGVPIIDVETFITEWKGVVNAEFVDDFESGKDRLAARCPEAQSYLTESHWENEELFALCYVKRWTTLGQRSTQRLEGLNGVLKGMLQVRSSTSLQSLFQTLQWASSETDRQAVATAAMHAARHPRGVTARTVDQDTHPYLTFHAATKVKQQHEVHHNYVLQQKVVAGRDSVWWVSDRRQVTAGRDEKMREVEARDDFMHCSCYWPTMYLLPCRHVIALNLHLFNQPFMSGQVGQRWLRSYRPRPEVYPNILDVPVRQVPDSTSAVPSSLVSNTVAAPPRSAQGRYGQMMGYCQNICSLGLGRLYDPIVKQLRSLSYWAESETAANESVITAELPTLPAGPTALHPTVEPQQLIVPKRRRGQTSKDKDRRKKSRGERAQSGISATQE